MILTAREDIGSVRITQQKLRGLINRSKQTIALWINAGHLPQMPPRRGAPLREIMESLADALSRERQKKLAEPRERTQERRSHADLSAESMRLDNDIKLMKRDELAGELIPREEVREHVGKMASQLARDLNSLRGQLKARMPELTPQALDWLDSRLATIRNNAAAGRWEEDE